MMTISMIVRSSTNRIATRLCRAAAVLAVAFLLIEPASGQAISLGVEAGVPVTRYFETGVSGSLHGTAQYSSATRRYTIGVTTEWHLTQTFGFEVDALYHRIGWVRTINLFDTASGYFSNSYLDVKGSSWDFPVMAKYRFHRRYWPFIAGGGVLRYVGPVHGYGVQTSGTPFTSSTTVLDTTDPFELRKRVYPGLVVGSGMQFSAGLLRLRPELRYTRWTANISGEGGLLRFAPNQVEFLVGILFWSPTFWLSDTELAE